MGSSHSTETEKERRVDVATASSVRGSGSGAAAGGGAGGAGAGGAGAGSGDHDGAPPSWVSGGGKRKVATVRRGGTFTSEELGLIERAFQELAARTPDTDTIAKADFLDKFPLPGLMGERLFACIDRDNTGVIDKTNYLIAVRLLSKEDQEGKTKLIFDMYDADDNEAVSREEMTNMLVDTAKSAFGIVTRFQPPKSEEESEAMLRDMVDTAKVMVADAFEYFDTNEDGNLSYDQFKKWAEKTPEVTRMLDAVMGAEGGRLLEVHTP